MGLDRNDKITPTISLFLTPPNFQELVTSIAFDGYTGIQRTNEMDVCCPNHSFSPKPAKERADLEESFVLLIPRCSASSPMLPISASRVGLTRNTEPLGVTFRLILESRIET